MDLPFSNILLKYDTAVYCTVVYLPNKPKKSFVIISDFQKNMIFTLSYVCVCIYVNTSFR